MSGLYGNQNILGQLPEMLSGEELLQRIQNLPFYDGAIKGEAKATRLMALNDLYKIYIPNEMSVEIYSKLYLSMLRSLDKKSTNAATTQLYKNFARGGSLYQKESNIASGCDSFTIIGASGIGKSFAISRALHLLNDRGFVELENPYLKIIPIMLVQCPFDCSPKGMILEIMRVMDNHLGTNYYEKSVKARSTTDLLISSISQLLLNHVGLLIVDEIQCVVHHKQGKTLVSLLTQLINNSGISICMVGTPEVIPFFESVSYLARRTLGLKYETLPFEDYFVGVCQKLFSYQYVKESIEPTQNVCRWLYEHSGGTLAMLVAILHDAQEISILEGKDALDMEVLNVAYEQRMCMMQGHIRPKTKVSHPGVRKQETRNEFVELVEQKSIQAFNEEFSINELSQKAKENNLDMVELLREKIVVEEVAI